MELNQLREQIDEVDKKLSELFIKRMELVREVKKVKVRQNIAVENKNREIDILTRLKSTCPNEFLPSLIRLYENIFEISKDFQKEND